MAAPIAFVGALIDEKKTAHDWIKFGDLGPLFLTDWERIVHDWIAEYIRQNGALPPREVLHKQFDDPFNAEGGSAYQHGIMVSRFTEHMIRTAGEASSAFLEDNNEYDAPKALGILADMVQRVKLDINPQFLLDSLEAIPKVWKDYLAKLKMTAWQKGLLLGWPTVDVGTGGIEGGEVISIVGRPATGKTWFLLWIACNGWMQQRRCAFVTLEMPASQIIERQIGIMTSTDYGPIKAKTKLVGNHKAMVEAWIEGSAKYTVPFYVIDSRMAATVADIETYCRAIDANVIYIDGAYLLRHPDGKLTRYQRVAENMDMIKDLAMRMDVPVVCSWQFNREAAKKFKKKAQDNPDIEDIGYSDAIGQHSSIILGLLQDEDMGESTTREVYIMKGRGGETGSFSVSWDFVHSFFGEKQAVIEKGAMML